MADESGADRKRLADAHSAIQHKIRTELEEEDHQQSRNDAEQNPEASHHRVQQLKAQVSTEVVTIQERIEAGLLSLSGPQCCANHAHGDDDGDDGEDESEGAGGQGSGRKFTRARRLLPFG